MSQKETKKGTTKAQGKEVDKSEGIVKGVKDAIKEAAEERAEDAGTAPVKVNPGSDHSEPEKNAIVMRSRRDTRASARAYQERQKAKKDKSNNN